MKKIFFILLLTTATTVTFTQTNVSPADKKKQERKDRISLLMKKYEEGSLIYSKQSAFGLKLNTDGWGIFYEHGKYKTLTNTNLWWVELGERHSPKEEKLTTVDQFGFAIGNPIVFGKINNLYTLKVGIGQQKLIGGKGNKNGVAVSAVYGGGISVGFLKPYFLTVLDSSDNVSDVKYDPAADNGFLDPNSIVGHPGFTKGFGDGTIVPGGFARVALRFDYGRYNELLSALEVGINADFYSKKMPIMANNKEKQFFFNAYVAIEFGSRK